MLIELDPVDRITADAVGPPGSRVFYIQGRKGDQVVTLLVEKQQVQLLAASVVEILSRVGKETGEGPPDKAMELEQPVVPEWRAGRLSIGYHEDRDLLMLEVEELIPDEEDSEEVYESEEGEEGTEELMEEGPEGLEGLEQELRTAGLRASLEEAGEESLEIEGSEAADPQRVRFWATREQMLSLARHGASVCAAGRPRCQLCGNPLEPEGHHCPALNGHRKAVES